MANVFHITIWAETDTRIDFTLGAEGAIATRQAADQVAAAYRELFANSTPDTRIGILEIPEPNPKFHYKPPLTDVSEVLAGLRETVQIH